MGLEKVASTCFYMLGKTLLNLPFVTMLMQLETSRNLNTASKVLLMIADLQQF